MERSAVVSTPSAVGAAGEAHSHSHAQQHHHHHHHQQHHLPDDALDKYDDMASDLSHSASRKRDLDDYDDDDDEDDDDGDDGADYSHNTINNSNSLKDASESKRLRSASASPASTKRLRRHTWQKKYAAEFGLVVIEKDHASGAVMLAMCGFCKAFGRENKIEHVLQSDDGDGDGKKRRRRSLTTIKFFRTFRIDNIRSHLQGAHPRRWAAFEALPKLDAVRARYLQVQGEATYDGIHMVDDVMLNSTTLQTESDVAYAQAQLHALAPHATSQALESPLPAAAIPHHTSASSPTAGATGASAGAAVTSSASSAPTAAVSTHANVQQAFLGARGTFDYEKHLTEQLALEREKLAFAKAKFAKDVELRERELALREKQMAHDRELHEKLRDAALEAAQQEHSKFFRLAEVLRDAVASAAHASAGGTPSLV